METITEHLKVVDLVEISTSKTNPRSDFNEQSIMELAESIKENGILQPLLVRPAEKGYELVCGERRLRACNYSLEINYIRCDRTQNVSIIIIK